MKRSIVFTLVILLALSAIPMDANAGPWTLKQGKFYGEFYGRYSDSKSFYDPKGKKHRWPDGGESQIWDMEAKFEYGATDELNLLLSIPYVHTRWENDWGSAWNDSWGDNSGRVNREGFKPISFGAKYRFVEKPFVASVQGKIFISPETDRVKAPDLYEYGNALELRGLIGKAFQIKKKLAYVSLESGYKWSSSFPQKNEWANMIPVFAEAGFAPLDRLMIKSEIDCMFSHQYTGRQKDTVIWRVGPIINILGKGFNSIEKGGDNSLNVELQYGQTLWARGDGRSAQYGNVSSAHEFIVKVQALF